MRRGGSLRFAFGTAFGLLIALSSSTGASATGTCKPSSSSSISVSIPGTVANPTNSRVDPACGLVSQEEVTAVFGREAAGPRGGPPSGREDESTCIYWTTAPKPTNLLSTASVVLYPSVSLGAFPSKKFEPANACAWTSVDVHVGEKAVAGTLLDVVPTDLADRVHR